MLKRLSPLNVFFKDADKKPWHQLLRELIVFAYIKRSLPIDYFRKFLYRKEIVNYLDYLTLNEHNNILDSKKIVFHEISELLNNKLSFKLICMSSNIPTSTMMGYNLKDRFVTEGMVQSIRTIENLIALFEILLNKTQNKRLFLKPLDGIGGEGCLLLTPENIKEQLNLYGNQILTTSFIHEACIEQHPEIKKIHPHAINTLRVLHYIDDKHNVHILSSLMRFGVGTSITDNLSKGGFCVGINSDTGSLKKNGHQWITKGGAIFYKHPETDFILEGFEIPYFKEACELVKLLGTYFPSRIVGWDIAITPTGPIVLEGNHNPGISMSEIAYGGFGSHPLIKELLKEIKTK